MDTYTWVTGHCEEFHYEHTLPHLQCQCRFYGGRYVVVEFLGHAVILRSRSENLSTVTDLFYTIINNTRGYWFLYNLANTYFPFSYVYPSWWACRAISPFYDWCLLGDNCFGASTDVFVGQLSIHLGKRLQRPFAFGFMVVCKVLLPYKALW